MAARQGGVPDDPCEVDELPLPRLGAAGSCALEDSLRRVVTEAMAVGFDDMQQKITSGQNMLSARIELILAALEGQQGPALHGGGCSRQPDKPADAGFSPRAHARPLMAWSSFEVREHREAADSVRKPSDQKTVHVMPPCAPPVQLHGGDKGDTAGGQSAQSGALNMKTAATAALATLRCANLKPKRALDRGGPALTLIDEGRSFTPVHAAQEVLETTGEELAPSAASKRLSMESITATLSTRSVNSTVSAAIMADLVPARSSGIDVYRLDALHTDRMLEFSIAAGERRLSLAGSDLVSPESSAVLAGSVCSILPESKTSSDGTSASGGRCDSAASGGAFDEAQTVIERQPVGSMDGLRRAQETELMSQVQLHTKRTRGQVIDGVCVAAGDTPWALLAPAYLLGAYGIVPGRASAASRWHLGAVVLAVVSLLAVRAHLTASSTRFRYMHLSEMCPALGALLGLVLLRSSSQIGALLGPGQVQLERYARLFGFHREWLHKSLQSFALVAALWLCVVAASSALMMRLEGVCVDHALGFAGCNALGLLYHAVGGGLFAALTYCQIHVCVALEMMVDKFCVRFFEAPNFSSAVNEWTVLQAILRRAANTIDSSILAMQTSLLVALLLMSAELFVGDGGPRGANAVLGAVSKLSLALLSLYGLFRASAVTEKCARVPALLNSLRFDGSPINFERQYVVTYVEQSAAGFYVRGVRLTTFMVLKMAYVAGMVAFAFATKVGNA